MHRRQLWHHSEFYVLPEYRNKKTGEALLQKAKHYAKTQAWKRLELCTPPVQEFQNTVDFYLNQDFEVTGGYKMKCAL
ncbi:GNAT family N-acetyltransferase [Aliamphritea spongicola]